MVWLWPGRSYATNSFHQLFSTWRRTGPIGDSAWPASAACKDRTKNTELSSDKKTDGDFSLLCQTYGEGAPALVAVLFQWDDRGSIVIEDQLQCEGLHQRREETEPTLVTGWDRGHIGDRVTGEHISLALSKCPYWWQTPHWKQGDGWRDTSSNYIMCSNSITLSFSMLLVMLSFVLFLLDPLKNPYQYFTNSVT